MSVPGLSTLRRFVARHLAVEVDIQYRVLVEQAADGIVVSDGLGKYLEVNSQACELAGYSRDELLRLSPADLVVADFELVPPPKIDRYVVGKTITREHHLRRGDGSIILVEVSSRLLPDGRVQAIIRDISERRRADQALRESEARLQLALTAAQLATWDLDMRSGTALLSPRLLEWIRPPDPASCNTIVELMRSVHRDDRQAIEHKLNAALAKGSGEFNFEYRTNPNRGAVLWLAAFGWVFADEQGPTRAIGVTADITARKEREAQLLHQAQHDSLTGLANRSLLNERLQSAVDEVKCGGAGFALLLIDLDHFKQVNDTLGHHAGDALLQSVAERLRNALRGTDTVARIGGDEFAIILRATSAHGAATVALALLEQLQKPVLLEGRPISIEASIGLACCPQDGFDAQLILRRADSAMYAAKAAGDGWRHYAAA